MTFKIENITFKRTIKIFMGKDLELMLLKKNNETPSV